MEKQLIDGLYGLVGYPVKHSFSPSMHNAAFKHLGIASEYRLFEKKAEELDVFFSLLPEHSIRGLNVTIPYKETVKKFITKFTEEAFLIGAVNTVKIEGKERIGHNTDGIGFLRHLSEVFTGDFSSGVVALLGAGGAAKAVAKSLAKNGSNEIVIFDIQKEKAENLSGEINNLFGPFRSRVAERVEELTEVEPRIFINATPVGMKEEDVLLIDPKTFSLRTFVYDLIYNPSETVLLRAARERGCRCSNGLGMLLYQGVESFKFWTGTEAPVEIMRNALESAVKK